MRCWSSGERKPKEFRVPLLVEFGPECNEITNSWSGFHNGADRLDGYGHNLRPDGPERYVDAYRHVVRLIRDKAGAGNITWVWHVNAADRHLEHWNQLESYYPGSQFVDWVGVSIFGARDPNLPDNNGSFRMQMDQVYQRLNALAGDKPVVVALFASVRDHVSVDPADWAKEALDDMFDGRWPRVNGFGWYNVWINASPLTINMRVRDVSSIAKAIKDTFNANEDQLQTTPIVGY